MRLVSAMTSPVPRSVTIRKPEPVTAPLTSADVTAMSFVAATRYTHDFCRTRRSTTPIGSAPPSRYELARPASPALPMTPSYPPKWGTPSADSTVGGTRVKGALADATCVDAASIAMLPHATRAPHGSAPR